MPFGSQFRNPVGLKIVPLPVIPHPKVPTGPFTISKPENQKIGVFYVVQERCARDFDAPKLRKGRPGLQGINFASDM